jgi:hypothetical protein
VLQREVDCELAAHGAPDHVDRFQVELIDESKQVRDR